MSNGYQTSPHIVFCHCGGERNESALFPKLADYLEKYPGKVTVLSDLCGLAVNKTEAVRQVFESGENFLLIGCYQRSMKHLLEKVLDKPFESMDIENENVLEAKSIEDIKQKISSFSENTDPGKHDVIRDESGWPSWYPVIDYQRCTICGQCADFCLFGVYENTTGQVKVINPQGCKNNCPACARICPSTAIIFPKYKNGGAIAGSDEIDEQAEHQRQAKDIEEFLGDDIYSALERRKAKRKSIIREEAMNKALLERDLALRETQKKN